MGWRDHVLANDFDADADHVANSVFGAKVSFAGSVRLVSRERPVVISRNGRDEAVVVFVRYDSDAHTRHQNAE